MPKISQLPAAVNINNTDLLPIVQAGETKEIAFSDLLKGDAGMDLLWRNGNAPVSKAANGYLKLPNGLIIQWGTAVHDVNGAKTITFPIAFPNAVLSAVAQYKGADYALDNNSAAILPISTAQANVVVDNGYDTYWIAIGY